MNQVAQPLIEAAFQKQNPPQKNKFEFGAAKRRGKRGVYLRKILQLDGTRSLPNAA